MVSHLSYTTHANTYWRDCYSSNLLYPREDRQLSKLLYVCKACQSVQEHESGCTYRQNLSEAAQESMGEKAYVSNDPTVGVTSSASSADLPCFCTMCGECLRCTSCGEPAGEDSDTSELDLADLSLSWYIPACIFSFVLCLHSACDWAFGLTWIGSAVAPWSTNVSYVSSKWCCLFPVAAAEGWYWYGEWKSLPLLLLLSYLFGVQSLYYVCTNPNCNYAWSPVRDQNKWKVIGLASLHIW